MNRSSLLLFPMFALAMVVTGCAAAAPSVLAPLPIDAPQLRERISGSVDCQLLARRTVEYVNHFRVLNGLEALPVQPQATSGAEWMSKYQARIARVTHVADVPGMQSLGDRYMKLGGPDDSYGAENAGFYCPWDPVRKEYRTYDEMARYIVTQWILSPAHHANLLAKGKMDGVVGVGITPGSLRRSQGVYATMDVFYRYPRVTTASISIGQ